METHQLKQLTNASNRKLGMLGGEYSSSKDGAVCRQKLNLIFKELSTQMVLLSEQNVTYAKN